MGYEDYLHNLEGLRKYLASDFTEYIKYHLRFEDGFQIGPPQEQIARFLSQPGREKLIIGFRGLSKTYLVKYYAGWRQLRVPTTKVKFVSDNLSNSQKMAKAYLQFLKFSPVMKLYAPKSTRLSRTRFDLDLVVPEKDPSVDCIGIDGSITSTRADLIISDDCENIDNSITPPLRENLLWKLSEFQAILHPAGRFLRGKDGFVLPADKRNRIVENLPESTQIVFIGTYQHRNSIYLPTEDLSHPIGKAQRLVIPALNRADDDPRALIVEGLEGKYVSAWPTRFSSEEILERRKDGAKFFLDYLCDVKSWSTTARVLRMDRLKTAELENQWTYCYVDPAQGGNCETAAAFGGPVDSRLYVSDLLAWRSEPTVWIPELVRACKERRVVELHVEAKPESLIGFIQQEATRQGAGLFVRKLTPKGDKTMRIVGALEYPINSGQVVFHPKVLQDVRTRDQLESLTSEPIGKNEQVDRIDALAHLVGAFASRLGASQQVSSARVG